MAFFLLSRYEEYLPHTSDQHGRFAAKVSVAHHYQFLQLPIIELWLFQLRNVLQQKFPTLIISPSLFKFSPTYDIDLAWAYLNRPWWRTVGSWMKNILTGEWQLASEQQNVLRGKMTDPYDTFAFLGQLQRQFHLQPIFFFLLADYGKYDKNIHPQNTALQSLIKTLHKQYQIGIHPSYQSNSSFQILTKEVRQLEQIIQRPIQHSRQHFLKLHLPDTYQNLLELNVIHDYSMGYADEIGFRAGISRPYFWYDLRKEEMTKLTIHPFCVMDVTLQQYLQLSPSTAVENVKRLIRTLQTVGGTFSTLWHNSSFSDTHGWVEWQNAYQQIVALASNQIIK
ncbi:MAG: polysaccharide deacetylase family protein [Saprospiraceae bacterium]